MADREGEKADAVRQGAEDQQQEEEYESDLDDAPLPAMRRRAAASDEEEEEDEEADGGLPLPRRGAGSGAESDGQGAAEEYGEEYDEEYEEYEEVYEDFEQGRGGAAAQAVAAPREAAEGADEDGEAGKEAAAAGEEGEEGKKESEPYAVPTAGAFYMHDDRFQESRGGRGRGRRTLSNRNLWNPKEEEAWVHDRFDEMHPRGYHNGNMRNPRGRSGGRVGGPGGRTRGVSRGNFRGNRSRAHNHDGNQNYSYVPKGSHVSLDNTKNAGPVLRDHRKNRAPKSSHAHNDDVDNLDVVPKESHTDYDGSRSRKATPSVVRGRGSRRYQPRRSTTEISSEQNDKSQKPENASSNANLVKHQPQNSNSRPEQGFPNKQSFASNLNSASPPFYPSRPSHQEQLIGQRGNAQPSTTSRPFSPPTGMEHVSPTPQNAPLLRGKAFVPKGTNMQSSPSTSSNTQSTLRMPTQMLGAQFGSSGRMPSFTQPTPTVLTEDAGVSSPRGSNKAVTRLPLKGQPGDLGEERASSFPYGGSHVLGATGGLSLGDKGFHGTPALFPVMQFGGQHPGVPGVPSIGMALPGFVSQQQLGVSNSEMAWLPILSGSAGGLGATYGSPYFAMDGSYYPRASEQASSSVNSREPSASNAPSQLKPPEITEVVNDEPSQRQNKPRRYSQMNLGQ
ncbi:hypothetical protein D1007_59639 [Hordeum vulgare]|uniref:Btz domain-containing protein n=2 Tax=Hordeum vulgare subsp. vulgare TaxID=112509 RepID=A0A8I6W7S3_HORVV|nr:protein MLN51 homolog [Hordeum vulgare subsp. vulgare]KAE8768836.1 hypothetical protein D1007_59639 [Hordeum vulgare]